MSLSFPHFASSLPCIINTFSLSRVCSSALFLVKNPGVSRQTRMSRANDRGYFGDTLLRRSARGVPYPVVIVLHDIRAVGVRAESIGERIRGFNDQLRKDVRIRISNFVISEAGQNTRNPAFISSEFGYDLLRCQIGCPLLIALVPYAQIQHVCTSLAAWRQLCRLVSRRLAVGNGRL